MAKTLQQILAEEKPEVVAKAIEQAAEILQKIDPEPATYEGQELIDIVKARLANPQPGVKVKL
jgi:vacuolar-type H+-ATPase subunit E/Vma4